MEEIIQVEKQPRGIRVTAEDRDVLFGFQELIDMQVNALHLLQYPGKYQVDIPQHRIVRKRMHR